MPFVLAGAFLISFSAVFVKLAHVGPGAAAFYRLVFGGAVLLGLALIRRENLRPSRGALVWSVAAALAFSGDLFFWHRSIAYVGVGLATLLANFEVFVLAIVGVVFLHERLTWRLSLAVPLALVGLFMIVGWNWTALPGDYHWGVWLGLLTAGCYSVYILTLRRSQAVPGSLKPVANIALISLMAAAFTGLLAWQKGESFVIPDVQSWLSLLGYGLLCQALGWTLISRGLPRIPASRVGLILILQPTLSYVWDVAFFAGPLGAVQLVGAALAIAAIYLGVTGRSK
jgi:drug/metabolite transporter (DMT)-like permease